jgi:hypothetical protein
MALLREPLVLHVPDARFCAQVRLFEHDDLEQAILRGRQLCRPRPSVRLHREGLLRHRGVAGHSFCRGQHRYLQGRNESFQGLGPRQRFSEDIDLFLD